MYALWSSLKRHRSPPSNLPDPWLIASLQGSILLSDSFSSPCVATGSLMRLILITVYLYQWGSERKADTESMNFNKENPPPHLICVLQRHATAGWRLISAGRVGLWVHHMEGLSSSHTIGFCVFIMLIWGGLRRVCVCVRVSSLIAAPLSFQNLPVSDMRSALTCALDESVS